MSALVSGTLSIFGAPARSDDARSVVGVASPRFQFVSGLSLLDHLRLAVPGPLLAEASGRLSRVRDVLPPFDVSVASGDELVADPRGRLLWSLALGVAMGAKLLGIDLADEGLSSFDSALMEFVRKEREVGTVLLLALRQDSPLLPHLDRSAVRKDDRWRVLPTR